MTARMTTRGRITIPKRVRDALRLHPGDGVHFEVGPSGEVIVRKAGAQSWKREDRFGAVRGKAQVKWRTDELMALLREGG